MTDLTRTERDSMGEVDVPADAYYGASTRRAVENFPISGSSMPDELIRALGRIKGAAARANARLGRLDTRVAEAIAVAAREVAEGRLNDQFVVDVYQTGSGTSTNMNANEVIANRAAELLGHPRGAREAVHPNDHVNLGQSSNDVVPTAIHVAAATSIRDELMAALGRLRETLASKSSELRDEIKTGRTHLQDATPIRIGQVFQGYVGQIDRCIARLDRAIDELREVALGGTAVGTGLNTHRQFARRTLEFVSSDTGIEFRETDNHFQAQATLDTVVATSGALRSVAVAVTKIADDIRFLASGPRCGIGELTIPAVQPGSSIMPGKVNPVIAESTIQACARAIGNDQTVLQCGLGGHFELNTMLPLAAAALLESVRLLSRASRNFADRCVAGIRSTARGAEMVELGLGLATGLVPLVGYDDAAEIAKEAASTGRTIREIALEHGIDATRLDEALDPLRMTEPDA